MNQKSSKKNYVILSLSLILAIVIMAIGYARLSGVLAINNSKSIPGEWDIRVIGAYENEKYGSAYSDSLTYTNLNVSFDAFLTKPGDYIRYKIKVKNYGNIDAKLNSILIVTDSKDNDAIVCSVEDIYEGEVLSSNSEKEFYIMVKYNSNQNIINNFDNIFVSLEYVQN